MVDEGGNALARWRKLREKDGYRGAVVLVTVGEENTRGSLVLGSLAEWFPS
jgi:hypothetical protein